MDLNVTKYVWKMAGDAFKKKVGREMTQKMSNGEIASSFGLMERRLMAIRPTHRSREFRETLK